MRKIYNACRLTSDSFKSKALALTKMRIGRFNIMKKRLFLVWRFEIQLDLDSISAFRWHCKRLVKDSFSIWRDNSTQLQLRRKGAEHKRWAMTAIQSIREASTKEEDTEVNHKDDEPSTNNYSKQVEKVLKARTAIASELDKEILRQQHNARRKRHEQEKSSFAKNWELKWSKVEDERVEAVIEHTRKWFSTKQGQNDLLKQLKQIESDLRSPSPDLSQSTLIALALLDGKLSQKGILAETFFSQLHHLADEYGMIGIDSFTSYLNKIDIKMTPSHLRDIFKEVEFRYKANRSILLSQVQERMKSTYEYFGIEGCRYKKYISQCHDMVIIHDVYTDMVR